MIKLKEEVNELLQKLGESKKYEAPEKIEKIKKKGIENERNNI